MAIACRPSDIGVRGVHRFLSSNSQPPHSILVVPNSAASNNPLLVKDTTRLKDMVLIGHNTSNLPITQLSYANLFSSSIVQQRVISL